MEPTIQLVVLLSGTSNRNVNALPYSKSKGLFINYGILPAEYLTKKFNLTVEEDQFLQKELKSQQSVLS